MWKESICHLSKNLKPKEIYVQENVSGRYVHLRFKFQKWAIDNPGPLVYLCMYYHDERFANNKLFTWQQNATESIHLPL